MRTPARSLSRRTCFAALAPALLSLAFVATGCGAEDIAPTTEATTPSVGCGGKCDSTDIRLLSSLSRADYQLGGPVDGADAGHGEDADAGEEAASEAFRLVATPADRYVDDLEEGHGLTAEIFTDEASSEAGEPGIDGDDAGAATADAGTSDTADAGAAPARLEVALVYSADEGAYLSDSVDTSALLPYQTLRVRVWGALGEATIDQSFTFAPEAVEGSEERPDPFAEAYDVDKEIIYLDPALPAPDYDYPRGTSPFSLGGTEFWQKWSGGLNPTYSYTAGTEAGRKCMYASARRFEAIMAAPPQALIDLEEDTNWSGSFFNWNDDFSHEEAYSSPRGAFLWAWRTGLIKWGSQTGKEGACHLPTFELVQRAAEGCLSRGERDDGEIQGCRASN